MLRQWVRVFKTAWWLDFHMNLFSYSWKFHFHHQVNLVLIN